MNLVEYADDSGNARTGWLVLGSVLLALVYLRGSRAARALVVVPTLIGAVIYGFAALADPHFVLVMAAFLGQALPLLSRPVRAYVQHEPVPTDAAPALV